jgi:transposase-like protein
LENWARLEIQDWLQELMVAEVTDVLGRGKSERRQPVDAKSGYRNGYGKPRNLTMSIGTVTVRRPRIRDIEERFESRVLPLFKRRTETVSELIPELYLHGLAHGDFDLALRGLLGEKAPLSASTVSRLKEKWHGEYEEWLARPLDELEVVYLWVDGVYVKAGLEKEKSAVLVAVAGLSDGTKIMLTLEAGHRESEASWSSLLRKLKKRGLKRPRLVIGDGHLGIWAAIRNVFPEAKEQRCWNHRILNVLDRIPKKSQPQAKPLLTAIPYAETLKDCEKRRPDSRSGALETIYRRPLTCSTRIGAGW